MNPERTAIYEKHSSQSAENRAWGESIALHIAHDGGKSASHTNEKRDIGDISIVTHGVRSCAKMKVR